MLVNKLPAGREGLSLKMECIAGVQNIRGGFKAEREFGFALAGRFPGLDLSEVDTQGVAMVVEIGDPRRLNLHQLSRVLVGAAKGGVKTAVINFRSKGLATAIPLFNLFAMVDESARLKELRKLEAAIRTGSNGRTPQGISGVHEMREEQS